MAIDYTTARGQVRLRIADFDEAAQLLTDEQLDAFLTVNRDNVLRASADALETIATSEVLVSKKIRTQDLSTDGPAVSAELRKQAAALRGRADAEDPDVEENGFDVVNFLPYPDAELEERRL